MKRIIKIFLLLVILLGSFFIKCEKEDQLRISKVTIGSVSDFTETTATVGGQVIDVGDNATACGHCWSANSKPTVGDNKKDLGGTVVKGNYNTQITGLSPNTKYYVRAYVMEGNNVVYSVGEVNFTTLAYGSTAITMDPTEVTDTSAKLNGTVNANGETAEVSFEWGISTAYGDTLSATPSVVNGNTVTNVSADLTGLTKGTTYHFRVIAEKLGKSYFGSDKVFKTDNLPVVSTGAVTVFTDSSAILGGNVSSDNGSTVTERGVCWSTISTDPDTLGDHQAIVSGLGVFEQNITGLIPETTYYVRAYATNGVGTTYGSTVEFSTNPTPTISVISPLAGEHWIGGESLNIEWDIINVGGDVSIYLLNPEMPDQEITKSELASAEKYTWTIPTGQEYRHNYTVKITSLNNSSVFAVSELFTLSEATGTEGTISDANMNLYNTIKIDKQWWMAENMKTINYSNNSSLVYGNTAGNITGDYTTKYYFEYNNDINNVDDYGRLYTWAAAMNGESNPNNERVQGVCPDGWHLPSDDEWKELEFAIGMDATHLDNIGFRGTDQGKNLKAQTLWATLNNTADSYKFSAVPAGYYDYTGSYHELTLITSFWSSTPNTNNQAVIRILMDIFPTVFRDYYDKAYGYSVRCVKD